MTKMDNKLEEKLEAYIASDMQDRQAAAIEQALLKKDVSYIKKSVESILKTLENSGKEIADKYITKAEFRPYKIAMNTIAGIMLAGVVGALLSLILKS